MKKKKLIEKLENLSGDMENFLSDSSLLTAVKDFRKIHGELDEIIGDLQDDVDNKKDEEEEDKEVDIKEES